MYSSLTSSDSAATDLVILVTSNVQVSSGKARSVPPVHRAGAGVGSGGITLGSAAAAAASGPAAFDSFTAFGRSWLNFSRL